MTQSSPKRSFARPWPTTTLVGLSVLVAASCAADTDETFTSSDPGIAAPVAQAAEAVPDLIAARVLRRAFPDHADRVLGKTFPHGFVLRDRQFVLGQNESRAMHLKVQMPQNAQAPIRLTAPSGHEIRVRQVDAEGEGELADRAVVYRRAAGTSFWTVTAGGTEEWLHLQAGAVTSDLDVAAAWEIEGATPMLINGYVALMDNEGVAQGWVTAPEAYSTEGRTVDLRLAVDGQRIELFADAQGEEVLLDPGWTAVAPATAGYWGATGTTLLNGNVLYANGYNGATIPTAAQLYNPATNMWTAGGNMLAGRYGPVAVLMNNGRVLVAGGQTFGGYVNSAETYNPVTNTWSAAAPMAVGRGLPTAALLANGRVLVAGGYDGTNFLTAAQVYDPATNTWSAAGNMATQRAWGMAARLSDGRVVVAGGFNGSVMTPVPLASVEIYDPATNSWAAGGMLTAGRYLAGISLLSTGRVLFAGGIDSTGFGVATSELFNPATNSWTATAPMPTAMGAQGFALLGTGQFISAAGFGAVMTNAASATFDPATSAWTGAGNVSVGRYLPASVTLQGGDALVIGGTTDGTLPSPVVDRYTAALAAGAACTMATQCASGNCVDGVCCTVAACAASDQCHNAGTCQAGTGVCSNPAKANGAACNDNNACTMSDTCQAGACTGAMPVVCAAMDQCHNVGTCNTMTGVCDNPAKPDGAACSDNNACTQTDTCTAGACMGANPVMCAAMDQCHDVGTCDTMTGLCSNPAKMDGSACNDSNACTTVDTCMAGACMGAMPVTCAAMDQCHDVGTCDTMTGMCSNPAKADGAMCDDGDGCTQTDSCTAGACMGSNPVVCAAMDQCHDAGTCDSATGTCSNPAKADGTACDDTDACTQTDACLAGICAGANPVTCMASDQCHDVGTCDPATGMCSDPSKADGAACDDGNGCTEADTCTAGVCNGAKPVTCTAQDECHEAGKCSATSGMCDNPAKPDGTACSNGTCQAGECKPDGAGGGGGSGGNGSGPTNDGGCGCRVAGDDNGPASSGFAALALAAMAMIRRRRSEQR